MAHDYKTRTIDYHEEQPPEWATDEEALDFYPRRAAKLVVKFYKQAEKEIEERKAKSAKTGVPLF